MRNWIIKHWMLSYDYKLFGTAFRHLRVVNTLMPLFVIAGMYNLLTPGFGFFQILSFVPFLAIFFFRQYFIDWESITPPELDWEQRFQLYAKEQDLSKGKGKAEAYTILKQKWIQKYKGRGKFVEVLRGVWPWIWIIGALLTFWIFGSHDPAYNELRGF